MSLIQISKRYLSYLLRSKSSHALPSQFLRELHEKVFKGPSAGIADLEVIRNRLLDSQQVIVSQDLGAGSSFRTEQRSLGQICKQSASSAGQCMLLYRLASYIKAGSVLELGSSVGISAAYLAQTGAEVDSIEGNPHLHRAAVDNFTSDGLRFHCGSFEDLLPEILREKGPFDLIYIDGNHRMKPTIEYFNQCLPHIHKRTVIIFDDIHWSSEMEQAWEEVKRHPGVTLSIDIFWCGMVFFKPELSDGHVTIRY